MRAMPAVKDKTPASRTRPTDLSGRGRLFVFEGPDGVGKTTLAGMLSQHFSKTEVPHSFLSFPGREPGTVSELIYRFYHDPAAFGVKAILPVTMQVIITAAHIEVVEARIKPLLSAGTHVILDRFWWSTWVYSTLTGVPSKARDLVIDLELQSWGETQPELIFLIQRSEPFAADVPNQNWPELVRLYEHIAELQSAFVPVQLVMNEGSLDDTLGVIISRIGGL